MTKELEAFYKIKARLIRVKDNTTYGSIIDLTNLDIIETALKKQKRKLDLIGEVLVDVSKGNYTNLNDAINEIREVLCNE